MQPRAVFVLPPVCGEQLLPAHHAAADRRARCEALSLRAGGAVWLSTPTQFVANSSWALNNSAEVGGCIYETYGMGNRISFFNDTLSGAPLQCMLREVYAPSAHRPALRSSLCHHGIRVVLMSARALSLQGIWPPRRAASTSVRRPAG